MIADAASLARAGDFFMKGPRMNQPKSLTEGPVAKSLILFAIPILLSNIFQQLYNSIDSAVVGQFAGSAALAAVGTTGSIINLLIGFFLGIATGTGVLYAMHYGAEDYAGLKKLIDTAMVISVAAAVIISAIGIGFCRPLLRWMDTPEDVLPLGVSYLRIFFSGTIVTMIYNVGAGMIRAEGDSVRPLIYLIIGGVMNLFLDLLLVAVFDMGVAGAAIATVAAQAVSAVLVVIRLTRLNPEYCFRPLHIRFDRVAAWDIIRISVPCGLQGSMFNISNLLVQVKINSFGTVAMAGVTTYNKIDGFVYMPNMALGLAVSTFVGQNIGAGKLERLRKGIRIALVLCLCLCIFNCSCVLLFHNTLFRIFTDDPAVMEYSALMMRFIAPFGWIFVFSEILGGAIRGAGQAMKVTLISALCVCVFRVLWLLTAVSFVHTIRMVFFCYPISWTLSTVTMIIFYFKGSVIMKTVRDHRDAARSE